MWRLKRPVFSEMLDSSSDYQMCPATCMLTSGEHRHCWLGRVVSKGNVPGLIDDVLRRGVAPLVARLQGRRFDPFNTACRHDRVEVTRTIIAAGVPLHSADSSRLMDAILNGDRWEIIRLFVAAGERCSKGLEQAVIESVIVRGTPQRLPVCILACGGRLGAVGGSWRKLTPPSTRELRVRQLASFGIEPHHENKVIFGMVDAQWKRIKRFAGDCKKRGVRGVWRIAVICLQSLAADVADLLRLGHLPMSDTLDLVRGLFGQAPHFEIVRQIISVLREHMTARAREFLPDDLGIWADKVVGDVMQWMF